MKVDSQFHLPIWGGIECSINRVKNSFYDQLEMNGFYNSSENINTLLFCNVQTVRFPVLWEKHEPVKDAVIDWHWAESELNILREKNIEPLVGLIHHGSGPAFTNLLDSHFPELFAEYAAKVARKFPWIKYYNPINEPLTTARFSGLYGLWYPHKKNDVSFIKILLNELKGVVLAMKEIKKVNPLASLIQTEDLGKTYSTPLLNYQARFENKRRWLTYDILTGKFTEKHALWPYFRRLGIKKEEMQFFLDNPCEIRMAGVNYYITSERYLDEHVRNYPQSTHGGNTLHNYADVEAVRVNIKEPHGVGHLLEELWERYQIPIAITEAHIHCFREEQIRWLKYIYNEALKAHAKGINIVAITCWAMFGSFGWDKLLTSFPGNYEMGAIDISANKLRYTALAKLIKSINEKQQSFENLVGDEGWWKRPNRFFKPVSVPKKLEIEVARPIIIIGKTGTLGYAFSRICTERKFHHYLLSRNVVDIANYSDVEKMIEKSNPWAIINAAGFVDIDRAEIEQDNCYRENNIGNRHLGTLCEQYGIKLITFSTDQVFDGEAITPYTESSAAQPLNIYGHSKLLAENFLLKENPSALIIRTSAFFGPWDKYNFITKCLETLAEGKIFEATNENIVSPTYIPHLVNTTLDLLMDDANGIWHLSNKGQTTWYAWARKAAAYAGFNEELVLQIHHNTIAARPKYSVLASEKYTLMPTLEKAMKEYMAAKFHKKSSLQLKN